MRAITNEETKKKLLEQLRSAVCIQLASWASCFFIEALLEDRCDAIVRMNQIARDYAEKKIRDSQLEEILFGRESVARAAEGGKRVRALANLTKPLRRQLLRITQNAVWLHNAFLNEAESIAEVRNCDPDIVLDLLSAIAEGSYDSPKIPEIHQTWFFGEVPSDSEPSVV